MPDPIEDFLELLPGSLGEDKTLTLALYRLVDTERATAREETRVDVDRLAVAINTAQVQPAELRLGRDLRVPAERVAAAYNGLPAAPDPLPSVPVERPTKTGRPRCPDCGLPQGRRGQHHRIGCPSAPVEEA